MGWTFFFMMVVLKLPIVALFWIVWWAAKAPEPEPAGIAEDGDGGGGSPRPKPKLPRPPRRGPHRGPAPRSPQRVRAGARRLRRSVRPHL